MNDTFYNEALEKFRGHFGSEPTIVAYAPGRIEVLGNHTDYNEGFVLSAAIDLGTFFLASPSEDKICRIVAGDLMEEAAFTIADPTPTSRHPWSDYVRGVFAKFCARSQPSSGFNGLFFSNIPLAAGLSSSAALEVANALALSALYDVDIPKLELARMCQSAEHDFAGVKCGLLDQISSLFGKKNQLIMSDFRSLDISNVPVGCDVFFLLCNTGVKHTLVDSEYNNRRLKCEEATAYFSSSLDRPVSALRDVTWDDWTALSSKMEPTMAKRAAHVIGENARTQKGVALLKDGNLKAFGELMFQSHESSRKYFENSCVELDFVVDTARSLPDILGARLSGAGFGGSAIVLVHPDNVSSVSATLANAYAERFGSPCDVTPVEPADGARVVMA